MGVIAIITLLGIIIRIDIVMAHDTVMVALVGIVTTIIGAFAGILKNPKQQVEGDAT